MTSKIGAGGNINNTRTGSGEVQKALRFAPGTNKDGSWFLNLKVQELYNALLRVGQKNLRFFDRLIIISLFVFSEGENGIHCRLLDLVEMPIPFQFLYPEERL